MTNQPTPSPDTGAHRVVPGTDFPFGNLDRLVRSPAVRDLVERLLDEHYDSGSGQVPSVDPQLLGRLGGASVPVETIRQILRSEAARRVIEDMLDEVAPAEAGFDELGGAM